MASNNSQSPLRIISLGGIGRMGKNMTLFEQRDEILIVDCGLMFPGDDTPGIDLIIPDMTYVLENAERVAGVILTHGHEDHTGGLPFLLEQMPALVWGTPLTLGLLGNRLSEFSPQDGTELIPMQDGERVQIGSFEIDVVRVNHSVRDGCGLGIHTDQGLVVHTGDFKFDQTPVGGLGPDFHTLASFGQQDPLALLVDCTNVEKPGFAGSESEVAQTFARGCFPRPRAGSSSPVLLHISRESSRSSSSPRRAGDAWQFPGAAWRATFETARALGLLDIPPGSEIPIDIAAEMLPREVTILATGSQGEPFSALTRMASGDHKWVKIGEGDTVILSASMIPGNEDMILCNVDNLFRAGAQVIYGPDQGVHVSGHGGREEIKLMLSLTRPRYVIPIHGNYRHLVLGKRLAVEMGVPEENVLLMDAGNSYEFRRGKAVRWRNVPAGSVNVDGLGVGDVGDVVIADRQALAESGIVLPVVALDAETGELLGGPEIYSRGFVYMNEADEIINELKDVVLLAYEEMAEQGKVDPEELYDRLRSVVGRRINALTGRRPMVLPVILPIGQTDEYVDDGEPVAAPEDEDADY